MKISAIIIAKNEENVIKKAFESISFCDEIIFVDDGSTDKTIEIAKKYTDKIYEHQSTGCVEGARQFAIDKATCNWILVIDADEEITKELRLEIQDTINQTNNLNGYYILRKDFMWGKELKYGDTGNKKLIRLAKKDKGKWPNNIHSIWQINGHIGELKNPILHYPHPTVSEFLREINNYTDIRAKELHDQGKKTYWWEIIAYPIGKFLFIYFFKLGILDGVIGLILAIMMSFYSFLVRSKLWLIENK